MIIEFSFILPVYNYENKIIGNVNRLINSIKKISNRYEIILINDGSRDETINKLIILKDRFKSVKIINLKTNFGKGYAIKKGIKKSRGKYLVFIDCDLPYFKKFKLVCSQIKQPNNDIIIISRGKGYFFESKKNRIAFFIRRIISSILSFFINIFLVKNFPDTQAGLKAFKAIYKNYLFSYKSNGFLFDIEILRKATKRKLNIKKIYAKSNIKDYNFSYNYNLKIYISVLKDFLKILLSRY